MKGLALAIETIHMKRMASLLLLILLFVPLIPAAAGPPASLHAQAELLALARSQPAALVSVIVQQSSAGTRLPALVSDLGGSVTRDLSLINAFAADVPAAAIARLARDPGVRWVSLDGPVQSTAVETVSTAWASTMGSAFPNNFDQSDAIVDGTIGPNGTYGSGGNGYASFAGFDLEPTPGNAITKVEAVLQVYTPDTLGHDFKLFVFKNGSQLKNYTVQHSGFGSLVGMSNSGEVIIDVTSALNWKWRDFTDTLEIGFDQTRFQNNDRVYYDAVGLRVTSRRGNDSSGDSDLPPPADSTVDPSGQINVYNQVIGASLLWNTNDKLQGKGIGVAVVDSGVANSKDLANRKTVGANFNQSYHRSKDRYGHGTFVAGIIAGTGSSSNGQVIGVAPKAKIINARVSDDQGMATEADVVAGLQWILQNQTKYNIRVVNLSLNAAVAQPYQVSPMDAAVEVLWFNGIVVVVSAGNNGTADLYPPANDPFVITVGATDDRGTAGLADDVVASYSAFGTTPAGFAKPDLVAPGTNIVSTLPQNDKLSMSMTRSANRVTTDYFRMSGTSMAAPMVSGAVALLLQDEPNLTPDQVKYRLLATANKSWPGYDAARAGAGYLDIAAAVYGTTTQSANTGIQASELLWTGSNPITWGSVNWNSVNWNSVNWNSVNWNSVNWNSVNWNSDYWGP